jgi:hypothetical protein
VGSPGTTSTSTLKHSGRESIAVTATFTPSNGALTLPTRMLPSGPSARPQRASRDRHGPGMLSASAAAGMRAGADPGCISSAARRAPSAAGSSACSAPTAASAAIAASSATRGSWKSLRVATRSQR